MRPRLDLQLKATVNLPAETSGVRKYALKVRNYDLLRLETFVPRVLVVYSMPRDPAAWMTLDRDGLTLRKCAYWVNLVGFPETKNTDSITIDLPTSNVFDVGSLRAMMQRARDGVRV